jgi:hypothetical protein
LRCTGIAGLVSARAVRRSTTSAGECGELALDLDRIDSFSATSNRALA